MFGPREPDPNAEEKWTQRLEWENEKQCEDVESAEPLTDEDIAAIKADEKYDANR